LTNVIEDAFLIAIMDDNLCSRQLLQDAFQILIPDVTVVIRQTHISFYDLSGVKRDNFEIPTTTILI
jgi:hypothetical protein